MNLAPLEFNYQLMSSFSKKEYNKLEMRKLRKTWRERKMLNKGQCPAEGCGMSLNKKYERYHVDCKYYREVITTLNVQSKEE